MNGSKTKAIRSMSNHKLKKWRNLTPKEKYHIEEHVQIRGNIKYVSLQLWCRGSRRDYQHFKKMYKNNETFELLVRRNGNEE